MLIVLFSKLYSFALNLFPLKNFCACMITEEKTKQMKLCIFCKERIVFLFFFSFCPHCVMVYKNKK